MVAKFPAGQFDAALRQFLRFLSFVIPPTIVLTYLLHPSLSASDFDSLRLFVGILLFNTSHVALTALMFLLMPELRTYSSARKNKLIRLSYLIAFFTLGLSAARYWVGQDRWFDDLFLRPIMFIATIHHSMFQTHGLMRQAQPDLADKSAVRHMLKPWMYAMVIISSVGYVLRLNN